MVSAAHTRKPRLVSVNFTDLRRINMFKNTNIIGEFYSCVCFFVFVGQNLTNAQLCKSCSSYFLPPRSTYLRSGKCLHFLQYVCVCLVGLGIDTNFNSVLIHKLAI